MSVLISGSLAYDSIMDFPGFFREHILPEQIHILNVCFVVDDISKNYGGCAGNIAYTMNLLGVNPHILSIFGKDGGEYRDYFEKQGISTAHIRSNNERFTSYASIVTDKDDNQITAYHNGASDRAEELSVHEVEESISLGIVAPTLLAAMMKHAQEFAAKKIPFVFDPGQQLPGFSSQKLEELLTLCSFYIVNDYEMRLTEQKTGKTEEELCKKIKTLIITRGAHGSYVYSDYGSIKTEISPCPVLEVHDPTGAGDAYRAGFFSAYILGKDLKICGRTGSVAASYAVEMRGTQKHRFSLEEFCERYRDTYKEFLSLK